MRLPCAIASSNSPRQFFLGRSVPLEISTHHLFVHLDDRFNERMVDLGRIDQCAGGAGPDNFESANDPFEIVPRNRSARLSGMQALAKTADWIDSSSAGKSIFSESILLMTIIPPATRFLPASWKDAAGCSPRCPSGHSRRSRPSRRPETAPIAWADEVGIAGPCPITLKRLPAYSKMRDGRFDRVFMGLLDFRRNRRRWCRPSTLGRAGDPRR